MTGVLVDVGDEVMVEYGALGRLGPGQQDDGLMVWDAGTSEGNFALVSG